MKRSVLFALTFFLNFAGIAQEKLTVGVHPGVELFTIIQMLAGKSNPPNPSAYSKEVSVYFDKYKEHPAVKKAATFGGYYDLPELGWCMSNFPDIKIYQPDSISWYKLYGKGNILEYLKLCKDFFNDTHFWSFYQQHLLRYNTWGDQLKAPVDSAQLINKLEGFYKYKADVKWYICIDPLNSSGSHAIMTKTLNPQFKDELVYMTGYFNRSSTTDKDPVFEFNNFDNLVWHEGSHIYISGVLEHYKSEIAKLSYLFNKEDEGMKRNGITNWPYCFDENMVRSITACLYKEYRTERQFKRQVARETVSDFIYVEELTPFIYQNYILSKRYKNFEEFFPQILTFLKKEHPEK